VFVKSISGFSVVVPVYNEEENIESLIAEIHAALDAMPEFEVLYVDDGSSDATAFRLTEAKTKYPRLRAVRHLNRCGQSAALASGVRVARYPWIVTLDGDGQNDPRDIPGLLAQASEREHPALATVDRRGAAPARGQLAPSRLVADSQRRARSSAA